MTPPKKKAETINFFITSTKIKQNNSTSFPWKTRTCWWILWSQFFMHRIYFISWKKKSCASYKNISSQSQLCLFQKCLLIINYVRNKNISSQLHLCTLQKCFLIITVMHGTKMSLHNHNYARYEKKIYGFCFLWGSPCTRSELIINK